jgi:putative salt-induced outer membrane protein YdiY
MNLRNGLKVLVTLGLLVSWLGVGSLAAQDERTLGWSDVAEATFVLTAGNATARTLGFKNTLEHLWEKASFKFGAGAVRTESGTTTRTASGTPENFIISEDTDTEVTAENYYLKGRADWGLSDAAFIYGGADWDRNTFAGIQNRYGFASGAGRSWFDTDSRRLKTDLGLTYTIQKDVVENPEGDDSFMGLRGSYDFFHKLTGTTDLASVLVVDENLSDTEDLRADWTNSLSVAMSQRLALKTSLQILFDNHPSLTSVPLNDTQVLTPLDKVDSLFTVAIVMNF